MTPEEKELIEKMGEALDFCMDWAVSKVTDDDKYSDMVDLQNDIKDLIREVCAE
jgi:hypothetical protein